MMVCLDTDVFINILRNNERTISIIKEIQKTNQMTTTVINNFELWKGFYRTKSVRDEKAIIELLDIISLLEFDEKASKKAAEIFEYLRKKGKTVDALDVMIASIAITNNEPLLTFNKKHFENIPGLKLM
ncbi:MAG: type II toxin-antitoxin system VapC family toxin [Nanoarchaeota archaeon]